MQAQLGIEHLSAALVTLAASVGTLAGAIMAFVAAWKAAIAAKDALHEASHVCKSLNTHIPALLKAIQQIAELTAWQRLRDIEAGRSSVETAPPATGQGRESEGLVPPPRSR